MSRLYDIKLLNEDIWKIEETDSKFYHSYKLINKEKYDIYFFNHIIGLEQLTDDEFLIFRRASRDDFEIRRVMLNNSKVEVIYDKKFSQFEFVNDNNILFTYWGRSGGYHIDGVYSVRDNKELENAEWLNGYLVNIFEDEDTKKKVLCVEDDISSIGVKDVLIFNVDTDTFEPSSMCYSLLRDSFIQINNKEDYLKLRAEDEKYIRIIDDISFENRRECIRKAKEKILSKK